MGHGLARRTLILKGITSGGKGVASASVRLFYSSVDGPVQAGLAGEAVTDSEGRFTVDGLATAPYQVCVRAQGVELLDPCEWSVPPPMVRAEEGRTGRGVTIVLQSGVAFKVRVDDPGKVMRTRTNPTGGASLVIGAWTAGGFFRPARLLTSDAGGHDYVLLMPPGTDFKLSFEGLGVDVMDEAGRKVEAGAATTLRGSLEAPPAALRYRLAPAPK